MDATETAAARSHNRSLAASGDGACRPAPAPEPPGSPNPHAPGASPLAREGSGFRAFQRDLQWLGEHDDVVPTRLHVAGVEPQSALGSPRMADPWQKWLDRGERAIDYVELEERCFHGGLSDSDLRRGASCASCAIRDADGKAIGHSGVRRRVTGHYRYPMRAALARARHARTPPGYPDPAAVAWAILAAGDWALAMARLADRYPVLGDPRVAYVVAARSVAAVRERFREEVPPRFLPRERPRSDSQLNAEAAS